MVRFGYKVDCWVDQLVLQLFNNFYHFRTWSIGRNEGLHVQNICHVEKELFPIFVLGDVGYLYSSNSWKYFAFSNSTA